MPIRLGILRLGIISSLYTGFVHLLWGIHPISSSSHYEVGQAYQPAGGRGFPASRRRQQRQRSTSISRRSSGTSPGAAPKYRTPLLRTTRNAASHSIFFVARSELATKRTAPVPISGLTRFRVNAAGRGPTACSGLPVSCVGLQGTFLPKDSIDALPANRTPAPVRLRAGIELDWTEQRTWRMFPLVTPAGDGAFAVHWCRVAQ
jgi:hypothetical protein